jgi:ABC-type nickel/cobalt efflux system permease component RcnA
MLALGSGFPERAELGRHGGCRNPGTWEGESGIPRASWLPRLAGINALRVREDPASINKEECCKGWHVHHTHTHTQECGRKHAHTKELAALGRQRQAGF